MKKLILLLFLAFAVNTVFAQWTTVGSIIYNNNTGQVGIGTSTPDKLLTVNGASHLGNDVNLTRTDNFASASLVVDNVITQNIFLQKTGGGNINGIYLNGNLISCNGSVGIGTTNVNTYKLAVNGSAIFTQAVVKLFSNWPDYVFKKGYQLPSLKSLEEYVRINGHLPGMPTADSVRKNGLDLGSTEAKLLEKIEQLTLYTIGLQDQVESLEAVNKKLEESSKQIDDLQKQIDELKALFKSKQ